MEGRSLAPHPPSPEGGLRRTRERGEGKIKIKVKIKIKIDQAALTPAPIGHDTPVPPSPQ